jgi:hypothetical protein
LESLANHPKKNRRMLPASEQVYPLIDYINIDINCKKMDLRNQNDPRGQLADHPGFRSLIDLDCSHWHRRCVR